MNLSDKYLARIDRIIRPLAIPNLTIVLVFGQAAMYLMGMSDPTIVSRSELIWREVMGGEVWRLLSFVFVPPEISFLFAIFYFMIFHMIGTAMERTWGTVRFSAYLYLGIVLTILASTVNPDLAINGLFLEMTIFLAFATYNPNYEFLMFFVLPVKVKYLAALQAGFYVLAILGTPGLARLIPLAAMANYMLYFAPRLLQFFQTSRRRMKHQVRVKQQTVTADRARHMCATCGIDSRTHPKMQFRYCSKCDGDKAYCEAHLANHEHV